MEPTEEQQAAVEIFNTKENLVLEAGAGTGKTTTLKLLAESSTRKGLYVAYNRAIAQEAAVKFPARADCRTAHSLAFRAVGRKYSSRLNSGFAPWSRVARFLEITELFQAGQRSLTVNTLARLAMEMVTNFCNSADPELQLRHRPYVDGLRVETKDEVIDYHPLLAETLLPAAVRAWTDLQKTESPDSPVKFSHDHYLKMWQLQSPRIEADYILLDEAQDANPVIASIVAQQDAQIIAVGDRAQAIYGWRGAVDFMESGLPDAAVSYLSKSWRFGDEIAIEANRWLEQLETPLRLTGNQEVDSVVWSEPIPAPDAVLCRSNAGALSAVLAEQADGMDVCLVGGATDIAKFCESAFELKTTGKTQHRDLVAFSSWDEVIDYVKESKAAVGDLGTWVNILDRYGIPKVLAAVKNCVPEEDADVVISTVHKAKGREWRSVRIHNDFTAPPGEDSRLSPAEIMLRYVAVTRAKEDLELGPLSPPSEEDSDEEAQERAQALHVPPAL